MRQNWYYIRINYVEPDQSGKKCLITRIKAQTRKNAVKRVLDLITAPDCISSISFVADPIPCDKKTARKKPRFDSGNKDRRSNYCAVYSGRDIQHYQHIKTGAIVSVDYYRNLKH